MNLIKEYKRKKFCNQIAVNIFFIALFLSMFTYVLDLRDFDVNIAEMKLYIMGDGTYVNPGFFSPSAPPERAWEYFGLILDTVAIALLASFISVPVGFFLSIFMSRNMLKIIFYKYPKLKFLKSILYFTATMIANVMRSVNELIWALILVAAVGLGPLAGVIALGIHSGGVMAKLMAERLEDIDDDVCWHNILDNAPLLNSFYYTVLPQIKPIFISTILYRFETDIRSATILGVVGAGGIGMYLKNTLENFQTNETALIILMIIILIFSVDKMSAF